MTGKTLTSIDIMSGRYLKSPPAGYEDISLELPLNVLGTGVHGKFMYWLLEGAWSVWSTLGMTGQWSSDGNKHTRVEFSVSGEKVVT